jgi:hypothetical protein
METELTYTQECKLRAAVKRLKFTEAELIAGSAGLRAVGEWVDNTDWDYFPRGKMNAIIIRVLGREWTPSVHNEDCHGIENCRGGKWYGCKMHDCSDPLWDAALNLAFDGDGDRTFEFECSMAFSSACNEYWKSKHPEAVTA